MSRKMNQKITLMHGVGLVLRGSQECFVSEASKCVEPALRDVDRVAAELRLVVVRGEKSDAEGEGTYFSDDIL